MLVRKFRQRGYGWLYSRGVLKSNYQKITTQTSRSAMECRPSVCGIIWNQNTIDAEEEYTELLIWFRLREKSHGSVWPNLIDQYLAEPAFWLQKSLGCQQFLGQRPTGPNKRAGPCQISPANIWSKIKGNNWAKLAWTAARNISKNFQSFSRYGLTLSGMVNDLPLHFSLKIKMNAV